jgi:hypothetical protein
MAKTDYGVDQRTFIWAWESSDSIEDCHAKLAEYAQRLNLRAMPKVVMLGRAADYRAAGLQLKKYKPGRKPGRPEVQELNDYIATLRAEKEKGKTPAAPKTDAKPVAAQPDQDPAVLAAAQQLLADLLAGRKVKFATKESS